ncbi:MAG: polysaccharide biosynthesis tyrosine autokinase, partial [Acidobacteriia bacterium]|nr:polysaccharide biosynthesis tyrosine autokinase [Terriglobia bacterium]
MKNVSHYLDDPERHPGGSAGAALLAAPRPYEMVDVPRPYVFEQEDSGKLVEYVQLLFRHKRALAASAVLGLGVALTAALIQQPTYRAHATLEIQDFNQNFLNKGLDNGPVETSETAETNFQTQIRLLQSESLLQRVMTDLNLHEAVGADNSGAGSQWRRWLHLPQAPRLPESERLLQKMAGNLTIRPAGQTRVVEVLYESPDATTAANVVNTLVSDFIEQSQELRWKSAQKTGEWLTRQLADMKGKLEQSEAQLQTVAKASGVISEAGKDSIEVDKLRELNNELSKAQAERLARQSKLELASKTPVESLPEVLDDPTIRDYSVKLTDLRRLLAELSSTLTPANYKVQQVQEQIAEVKSALEKARANVINRIQSEYASAMRHEYLLARACQEQNKVVANESDRAVQYNMMKHEVDTSRQMYEVLLQRVKEAGVASAMNTSNILVVDPARRPLLPYKPKFLLNSAIGLFGGIFLGVGFVFFREQANKSVRQPGELAGHLNVPELGVIPEAPVGFLQTIAHPSKRLAIAGSNGAPKEQNGHDLELITWNQKPSLMAESFRATLPSILLAGVDGVRPRVIALTSPHPGEGKTTVSTNLAIAIAEITKRVLIVDGDLRKPRLHSIFSLPNERGVGELLARYEPLTRLEVMEAICSTEVPGLSALTSGSMGEAASNLFYSQRLPELLAI